MPEFIGSSFDKAGRSLIDPAFFFGFVGKTFDQAGGFMGIEITGNRGRSKSIVDTLSSIDWRGYGELVAGVDEVGRGCVAGDVYAAAVVFNPDQLEIDFEQQLTDSKLLSEKKREELAELIIKNHWVGIGKADVQEIDEINILQASLRAMERAIAALPNVPRFCLIDGNQKVPNLKMFQECIVKGDLRVSVISAASIVAKVTRDREMKRLDAIYPGFGFGDHKGYGTKAHLEQIARLKPCAIHRRSFKGVKEWLQQGQEI